MTKEKQIIKLEEEIKKLQEQIKNEPVIQIIKSKKLEWGKVCKEEMNWEEAKKWCKKQGEDWRLPIITELGQAYYDKIKGFRAGYYWSSTENSEPSAYDRSFSSGSENNSSKTNDNSVRCVREVK